ncbi:AT-hook motif nuclear-localized protein 9-like [Benincasa hispida]|uniref:AT-hook motif nuclear-localized protein 9-like n=1 Tax=Benincasa hispida TaxID=102211 RepID=UPI0019014151|nr:AT-hook motif nuclear-localized protein 9-like [Benincasa hispida]
MEPQNGRNFTVKCECPENQQDINNLENYTAADDEQRSNGSGEIVEEKKLSESADEEIISKKKKRGRPRKNDAVDRKLPPQQSFASSADSQTISKRRLGRRPGRGKLQLLAPLGGYAWDPAGGSFTPHVVLVAPGEDIVDRISTFSVPGPRAICIISAVGLVSTVIIHKPGSTLASTIRFEGTFEILQLSGWFFGGDQMKRISISFSKPDGQVFGGIIASSLIAATPIQIIVGSFKQKIEQ